MPSGQHSRYLSWFSVPVGAAVASGTLLWAPPSGESATMLAIALFAITLWIANPVPPTFTGLVVIGLVGITFSPDLAFIGFRSAAMWLVVFGLLLGEAARASGLTHWGSRRIITRAWPGGAPGDSITAVRAYRRLLLALGLGGLALSFVIPSALVRVLTIVPFVTEIGDVFESDRARLGVFLGPTLVTFYAAPGVFTAGLPNIIATGIADSLGAPTMSWSAWTLRMFPIMGLERALVVVAVIYVLYRPPEETTVKGPSGEADQIGTERRMLLSCSAAFSSG